MNAHDDRLGWLLPALVELHASIVGPDGSVGAIDKAPSPYWCSTHMTRIQSDAEGKVTITTIEPEDFLVPFKPPATDGRDEYVGASPGVRNPRHQVIGVDRGSCETFPRASLKGAGHD